MLDTRVSASADTALRPAETAAADQLLAQLLPERFDPQRVSDAVGYFLPPRRVMQHAVSRSTDAPAGKAAGVGFGYSDGRTFTLALGPGVVTLKCVDRVRAERSIERAGLVARKVVDLGMRRLVDVPLTATGSGDSSRRRITAWSARSRARMVRAFCEVDWSSILDPAEPLGMLTVTYAGGHGAHPDGETCPDPARCQDWLRWAPNGRAVKRHMRLLQLRFRRATGKPLRGAWKLEFQRRGAPHVHIIAPVPAMVQGRTFEEWFSATWADIVAVTDPVERVKHLLAGTAVDFAKTGRMTDPKRLAVYFGKHSSKTADDKEYQHIVPEAWQSDGDGPGRFWGIWGLPKAVEALELDVDDFVTARRVMRKAMHAKARRVAHDRAYHAAMRECYDRVRAGRLARAAADRVPKRWTLGSSGALTGGFLVVNDGPAFALGVALAIRMRRGQHLPSALAPSERWW